MYLKHETRRTQVADPLFERLTEAYTEVEAWRRMAERLAERLDYLYPNTDVLDDFAEMQEKANRV